jgi:hypothetical protein
VAAHIRNVASSNRPDSAWNFAAIIAMSLMAIS